MNKIITYIWLTLGIILAAIFYILASYYFRYGEYHNIQFQYIFIISVCLGIISYMIKIPIFYYLGKDLSIMVINIIFLIIAFILVVLYSKFILHEIIPIYTYTIIVMIVLLILLNQLLDIKYSNKS
jgi:hypothetical protein